MKTHRKNKGLSPLISRQKLSQAIGHQIYLTRKLYGLTGKELGDKLGVSQQQISRYERGICRIDIDVLVCFLNELNMSLNEFFINVSLNLKEISPRIYEEFHSLFIPLLNYVPDGRPLIKKESIH
ncbi:MULTISPECIES: helix-turn-helix domain-containing protein [unclassified Providencia]|uniref:helix-turn-helix domain-containing protein n=1 Tax=unclassified Providencia TaxID=2633465 RepID=UPI00234B95FA|nr:MULTISPECIES: helix-turn-helix transcriptional regulator [unclassified Providencia]